MKLELTWNTQEQKQHTDTHAWTHTHMGTQATLLLILSGVLLIDYLWIHPCKSIPSLMNFGRLPGEGISMLYVNHLREVENNPFLTTTTTAVLFPSAKPASRQRCAPNVCSPLIPIVVHQLTFNTEIYKDNLPTMFKNYQQTHSTMANISVVHLETTKTRRTGRYTFFLNMYMSQHVGGR